MKILKIHVEHFGCLSKQDISLAEGLNSVVEENGYGKSTLGMFIATMFYGFMDEKTSKKSDGLRDQYKPWDGGKFGGYMDVSCEFGELRIERTFGARPKDDLLNVYTLPALIKTDIWGEKPGITLFQIDTESFLRTIFLSDSDSHVDFTDDVHAKVGNLVTDDADVNRFKKADEALKNLLNKLTPARTTGRLYAIADRIGKCNLALSTKSSIEDTMGAYRDEISSLRATKEAEVKALGEVNEKIKRRASLDAAAVDRTKLETMKAEADERKAAYDRAVKAFPGSVPTKEQVDDLEKWVADLSTESEVLKNVRFSEKEEKRFSDAQALFSMSTLFDGEEETIEAEFESYRESTAQVASLTEERDVILEDNERNRLSREAVQTGKKKTAVLIAVVGVLFAAFGILAVAMNWFDAPVIKAIVFAVLGIGMLLLIAGIALLLMTKRTTLEAIPGDDLLLFKEKELERATASMEASKTRLTSFFSRFHKAFSEETFRMDLRELVSAKDDLETFTEKRNQLSVHRDEINRLRGLIVSTLRSLSYEEDDISGSLSRLAEAFDVYADAERECVAAQKKLDDYKKTIDEEKVTGVEDDPTLEKADVLSEKRNEVAARIEELDTRMREIDREIEKLDRRLEEIQEAEQERDKLLEEKDTLSKKLNIATKTRALLTQAKQNLAARFQSPIENAFIGYLNEVIGEGTRTFKLDGDGHILTEDAGSLHDMKHLSHGYRDLVSFCMRIALVDAMYENEKPMLLLDDPFVNLDEEKIEKAKVLVNKLAERYQILYMSCHESRKI